MLSKIIEAALDERDIAFIPNKPLDFYLPAQGIHIHVKPDSAECRQFEAADNVIVVQGRQAVNFLAGAIRGSKV